MKRSIFFAILGLLTLESVIYLILSFLHLPYSNNLDLFTSLWAFEAAAIATLSVGILAFIYDWRSSQGRPWLFIAFGFLLWTFGELIWTFLVYEGGKPVYSIADLAWVLGYPFLAVGFYYLNLGLASKMNNVYQILYGIFVIIIASILLYILGPSIISGGEAGVFFSSSFITIYTNDVEAIIGLFYPLGDMVILFFAGRMLLKFRTVEIGKPYILLVLGVVLEVIADSLYFYQANILGTYGTFAFEFVDWLFITAYFVITAGALVYYHLVSEALGQ